MDMFSTSGAENKYPILYCPFVSHHYQAEHFVKYWGPGDIRFNYDPDIGSIDYQPQLSRNSAIIPTTPSVSDGYGTAYNLLSLKLDPRIQKYDNNLFTFDSIVRIDIAYPFPSSNYSPENVDINQNFIKIVYGIEYLNGKYLYINSTAGAQSSLEG